MATSGNTRFNATANDILTEALGLVVVYSPGESLDDSESADALRSLNMMLKAGQWRHGIWLHRELTLFLQADTVSYLLGPTGDHCAENAAKTELAAAAAAGATSVSIDATTGFGDTFDRDGLVIATTPAGAGAVTLDGDLVTNGIATLASQRKILVYSDANDSGVSFGITGQTAEGVAVTETLTGPNTTTVYSANTYKTISSITIDGAGTGNIEIGQVGDHVGIELDSGSMQWTNIGAALSTTLAVIDALSGAAAVDNHVYSYARKTSRPIEIIEARLHKANDYEVPLTIGGRNDYMMLANKNSEGPPNQIYYDKQRTNGALKVWPEPNDVQEYIKMSARVEMEAIDSLTDDIEMTAEWFEAVAWNLALRLFPKYGKPIDPGFIAMAQGMLDAAMDSDTENASVTFQIG